MTVKLLVGKSQLSGEVSAPPSKSYTHRAFIASLLSEGTSTIINPLISRDTLATLDACKAFGAGVKELKEGFAIKGVSPPMVPDGIVDCGASASTMRFLLPVAALADGVSVFTGDKSLRRRPMGVAIDVLSQMGVTVYSAKGEGYAPLIVLGEGKLKGGMVSMSGNVSSQFISGILLASPLAVSDVTIKLTTKLESKPYVEMTIDVLRRYGVNVQASKDMRTLNVPAPQQYKPTRYHVEGDFSNAAFLLAAAAVTRSRVTVKGLNPASLQADRRIIDILKAMGIPVLTGDDHVTVEGGEMKAVKVNVSDSPDLAPVVVALACHAKGESRVVGARRLRLKESDRIASLSMELAKLGAEVKATEDGFIVKGPCKLKATTIDPHADHRVAMACTIAALNADGVTRVEDPRCIDKSYPNFIKDLKKLGATIEVEG